MDLKKTVLGDDNFSVNHKILNVILLAATVFSLISVITNFITKEPPAVQSAAAFFVIFSGVCFFLSRFRGIFLPVAHVFVFVSYIGLAFFYIYDGGIFCGNGYLLIMMGLMVVTLFKGKQRFFYLFTLAAMTFVLIYFELTYPHLIRKLSQEQCVTFVFASFLFVAFCSILLVSIFVDILQRKNYEIEKMSRTDFLTGIANRRSILEDLNRLSSVSKKNGRVFSILLMDIDNFKSINDTYGHSCGDLVLKKFARIVEEVLRDSDYFGRWGGEEFLIILPGTDLKEAVKVAERIKSKVAEKRFDCRSAQVKLSVTIGVCRYDPHLTLDENLHIVDEAMYKGKRSGKNTVSF